MNTYLYNHKHKLHHLKEICHYKNGLVHGELIEFNLGCKIIYQADRGTILRADHYDDNHKLFSSEIWHKCGCVSEMDRCDVCRPITLSSKLVWVGLLGVASFAIGYYLSK